MTDTAPPRWIHPTAANESSTATTAICGTASSRTELRIALVLDPANRPSSFLSCVVGAFA